MQNAALCCIADRVNLQTVNVPILPSVSNTTQCSIQSLVDLSLLNGIPLLDGIIYLGSVTVAVIFNINVVQTNILYFIFC